MNAPSRRALLWLPDLDLTTLRWAVNHPVHRTGLARWWQRSQATGYQTSGRQLHDVIWPNAAVRWDDLARYLREHPSLATALQQGGAVRVLTATSARDMLAVLLGLAAQFPAVEILVDLIVDNGELLEMWLSESRFQVVTVLPPNISEQSLTAAIIDRHGIELTATDATLAYLHAHRDWTAVICGTILSEPVLTLLDDRFHPWFGIEGVRVSELLATHSPNLWQVLSQQVDPPHIAVHEDTKGDLLHTIPPELTHCFADNRSIVAEMFSVTPRLLTVVAPSFRSDTWPEYDDQLALLLGQLYSAGYDTLGFGVPTGLSTKRYPIFYLSGSDQGSAATNQRAAQLTDVSDAVWSFTGASDAPSWLLQDVLLS